MRRARPTTPRAPWPVALAGFLLGFVAVFRWQQWQDMRLLRQMEAQDTTPSPSRPLTPDDGGC